MAAHPAAVMSIADTKVNQVTTQLAIHDRKGTPAGFENPGDPLKALLESEFALWKSPCAFHLCRHNP